MTVETYVAASLGSIGVLTFLWKIASAWTEIAKDVKDIKGLLLEGEERMEKHDSQLQNHEVRISLLEKS